MDTSKTGNLSAASPLEAAENERGPKRVKTALWCVLGVLWGITLSGCASVPATPPTPVTVQLKWVHQAQFAGLYVAKEQGYYAEENIDVTLVEGGTGINALEHLVTGQADFAIAAPDAILVQRSLGDPLVAIATIYRKSPVVFISLAGSGIKRPADLIGRSIALTGPIDLELQFYALINKLGINIQQIEIRPHSYDLTAFTQGEVDSTAIYSIGGLLRLRQQGYQMNMIWPSDYGVHMYADTIVTTEQLVTNRPDLVTRFLRATLRGWQDAIRNPDAAVSSTLIYAKEIDQELQTLMLDASIPLIHTGEDHVGWMRVEVWEGMQSILLEQHLLDAPVALDETYTLEFLQAIYETNP